MQYHLLTGATGLLGYYLLRDAAQQGIPLVVVVRPSRTADARNRIEQLLAQWEETAGYALARPVVLEGDLTRPRLGLDPATVAWVGEHCNALIHNAASLSFLAKTPEDEPYRTNVTGTRHVLELCRELGIRRFHHVSTAYVCGLRTGVVREDELDVGQTPGNDYERSKIQAETMVREAPYLDSPTVFRPAIIIGDSKTGYTSTFHGFYVPLKITHGVVQGRTMTSRIDLGELIQLFHLDGSEGKNFVPVDWVSQVMMRVIAAPDWHGRTYHLTPTQAVRLGDMAEVILEVMEAELQARRTTRGAVGLSDYQDLLKEQLEVYRAYWRDDPIFDRTNTLAASADLPCPEVDRAMLHRMCEFAVRSNFGWPIPAPPTVECDLAALLDRYRVPHEENGETNGCLSIRVTVTGSGGGEWTLATAGNRILGVTEGAKDRCDASVHMNVRTFLDLRRGVYTIDRALKTGRLCVELTTIPVSEALAVIEQLLR